MNPMWHDEFEYRDGLLIRKARADRSDQWNSRYAGKAAGHLRGDGYIRVRTNLGKRYAQVVVWEMHFGPAPEGLDVDHTNRDRADNRIGNLRLATRAQNKANAPLYRVNKTGAKGVTRTPNGKFQVSIGKYPTQYVGLFETLPDAVAAYEAAAKKRYGEFGSAK